MNSLKLTNNMLLPNDETCHPCCENAANSVLCTPDNDEFQLPDWKFLLRKCTVFTSIFLPVVERYSSNQAPIITLNTYINS